MKSISLLMFFMFHFVLFSSVMVMAEEKVVTIEDVEKEDIREDFNAENLEGNNAGNEYEQEEINERNESVNEEPAEEAIDEETIQSAPQETQSSQAASQPVSYEEEIGPNVKRITGIEFKQTQTSSRVIIRLNEVASFKTYTENDGSMIVIDLHNTILPGKWKRFLDTSEFRSAISFVKPYAIARRQNNVKVIIQLRDRVAVDVRREGLSIVAEAEIPEKYFKAHPGEVAQDKVPQKLPEETKAEEASSDKEEIATEDPELAENLQEEGEFTEKGDLNVDEIVAEEEEGAAPSSPQDSFLGVSGSEIEGFTIKELAEDHKYTGKPITVHFKNAKLPHVLDFISEVSGMNIVIADDVDGNITLKLRNVPWDQVLSLVLKTKALGAVRHGNVIRVSKLASLSEEQKKALEAMEAAQKMEPLRTYVFPLSYSSASDMEKVLKEMKSDKGKIQIDSRTNTVILRDTEKTILRIKNLLTKLDTQTPQVLIESKIIEISETFSRGLNFRWSALGGKLFDSPLTSLSNVSVGTEPKGTVSGQLSLAFLNLDRIGDVALALQVGEERNHVKLLSAPRIITQDNKLATIKQTEQIAIRTTLRKTNDDGDVTETDVINTYSADLTLNVKPHITTDGGVVMELEIINEFFKDVSTGTKASRSAKTNVLVENGDTTVIGGIYSTQKNKTRTGVPFLSWIPIIGWLFSNNTTTSLRNELLIFLTPTITNYDKAFVAAESLDANKNVEGDISEEGGDFENYQQEEASGQEYEDEELENEGEAIENEESLQEENEELQNELENQNAMSQENDLSQNAQEEYQNENYQNQEYQNNGQTQGENPQVQEQTNTAQQEGNVNNANSQAEQSDQSNESEGNQENQEDWGEEELD